MLTDMAIDCVRRFAAASDLGPKEIAERAGVSESALRHMHISGWSPSTRTLRKIEAIVPEDFKAAFLADRSAT